MTQAVRDRPRWRCRAAAWWPYLPPLVAPLALLAPFVFGRQVLYWGTPLLQFYPWRQLALAAVRAGEWPLWNPYLGNGAPLLANHQSALLYPPNWLGLVVPLELALSWLAALHLSWAGAGMVALARRLGLSPLGQAVAGLAFGLGQYLVGRVGFISMDAALAWVPWAVLAVEVVTSPPSMAMNAVGAGDTARSGQAPSAVPAALALAVIVALQWLAGHAQIAWYTLLLAGAWALWRLLRPGLAWRQRAARGGLLAGAVALGLGLAAAQLVPTAELMQQSPRAASAERSFVMTYSYSPWRLFTLLAPDYLGNPARGRFYGYGNYWEDAAYQGVLPLLLALGAAAGSLGALARRRAPGWDGRLRLFLIGMAAVSLLLALGQNTPIFPYFYDHVPTFNLFQAPARMLIWLVFAVALLAGLGASHWTAPQGRALYWTRLGTLGTVGLIAIGLGAGLVLDPAAPHTGQVLTAARGMAWAGVGLGLAGGLALLKDHLAPRAWQALVVVFVAGDLIVAGYGLNPGGPADLYRRTPAGVEALATSLAGHRLFQFPDDEYRVKFGRFLDFARFGPPELAYATREAMLPNTALLGGLASANNFDPLVSARYAGLMQVISDTRSLDLLRLMDVGVVASSQPLDLPELAGGGPAAGGVRFYQVPGSPQRAWVVYSAQAVADGDAALRALADPSADVAGTVILEATQTGERASGGFGAAHQPESGDLAREAAARPEGRAEPVVALTGTLNTVTIAVTLREAGWVVLADSYYPGWTAAVDGAPVPLLRANYAFRAVAVPAGEHTVVFAYRPRAWRLGLTITAVCALAWLGLAAFHLAGSPWRRGGKRAG